MTIGLYKEVNENRFILPEMGEYYDEDLIKEYASSINQSQPKTVLYYMEDPFTTSLGYHADQGAFVLKAKPVIKSTDSTTHCTGQRQEELNKMDADTISFYLEDGLNDGGNAFTINNKTYKSFKDYAYQKMDTSSFQNKIFKIRTIGINAPEVVHYSSGPLKVNDITTRFKELTYSQMQQENNIVYQVNKSRDAKTKYGFMLINNKWREVKDYNSNKIHKQDGWDNTTYFIENVKANGFAGLDPYSTALDYSGPKESQDNVYYFIYVDTDAQTASDNKNGIDLGQAATDKALELLNIAQDIRIVIDANQLYTSAQYSYVNGILQEGWDLERSIEENVSALFTQAFGENVYLYGGYNTFGQDSYKRFLGAIYVKADLASTGSTWINLAKYVRAEIGNAVALMPGLSPADRAYGNGVSDAFKIWSYDDSKTVIADAIFDISKEDFDDRRAIQKEITGLDFSNYKDYTVMIGDCLFMVPPTSIRVVNQIDSNRVQLLRSKGSMLKTKPHVEKVIEMTLYFNDDHGINGVPIKKQLPKQVGTDKYETYYMNGLRTLIAMFKRTPFLPIENTYLNETLGVEAVALASMQIQTMPMYPKCLAVTLVLQDFNYRVFMNELPVPSPDNGESYTKNMFASTINYGVMRHYYQQAINAGTAIKDLDCDSQEFIEQTMGGKTKLIPMPFQDQRISFKTLDKNWLSKMKEVKELASKQPLNQLQPINQKCVTWLEGVGRTCGAIINKLQNGWSYEGVKSSTLIAQQLSQELLKQGNLPFFLNIVAGEVPLLDSTNLDIIILDVQFETESLTKNELANMSAAISKELDLESSDRNIFANGKLTFRFPISTVIKNNKSIHTLRLDTSDEGYQVAEFCAFRSGMVNSDEDISGGWADFATITNEMFAEDLKDNAIDTETLLSAKFEGQPIDEIVVQQFSISMTNSLSSTHLKVEDGSSAQFTGGQDTIVDIMLHTTDESTVTWLNYLQEEATDTLIEYRNIITCWPIRIDSELTRLCGIYEIAIESVDISTVPNQPGLYAIQLRAISVDRTMRNKESLQKLQNINNAGSVNSTGANSLVYKTYFDFNNELAKAELYPDLELPTIEDLEETGYKFIKYSKNRSGRIYPDPDFYFIYGHSYTSQMLRKAIVEYFSNDVISTRKTDFYSDDSVQSAIATGQAGDEVISFEFTDKEDQVKYENKVKQTQELITKAKSSIGKKIAKQSNDLYTAQNAYKNDLSAITIKSWDICKDIKCTMADTPTSVLNNTDFTQNVEDVSKRVIEIIDDILSKPINIKECSIDKPLAGYAYHTKLCSKIKKFMKAELDNGGSWYKIFEAFNSSQDNNSWWSKLIKVFGFETDNRNNKIICAIYEAAAMSLSGNIEYSSKADKDSYCAKMFINNPLTNGTPHYYSKIIDKDTSSIYMATSLEQAIEQGITFGTYQIQKYDMDYLKSFYYSDNVNFSNKDFLDPYYNTALHKSKFKKDIDQTEYKTYLLQSSDYSIRAFHRLVLVWLKKLIQEKNFFSYYDIQRDTYSDTLKKLINEVQKDFNNKAQQGESMLDPSTATTGSNLSADEFSDYLLLKQSTENILDEANKTLELIEEYDACLVSGKIFLAVCCAVVQGDNSIYGRIVAQDLGTLRTKTHNCQKPNAVTDDLSLGERYFRKLVRGLVGSEFKALRDFSLIAGQSVTKLEEAENTYLEKLWVSASEDPSKWVLHSFYDMVIHNKRGRMARAFPTYYMLMIDEGRKIGYWKLHDNFYNMSSIAEMEVVKSRKIAADTATITMTNMYGTFTTDDEDVRTDYTHNIRDVWNSIFSPNIYFDQEETARMQQMNVNKVKLQPGIRIHLRMGYSGDASELPILFNGVVSDVSTGEVVELTAQGDGHELTNNNAFATAKSDDAADLQYESDMWGWKALESFFTQSATPKEILTSILTTKGTFFQKIINSVSNGALYNNNMFGIVHFGEIDYTEIHENGEVVQNIYEGCGSMPWHKNVEEGSLTGEYSQKGPATFTIELQDKSVWDVMHICASTSSEFMTSVAPFGIRSTIFHGRPHYYYAYDYAISEDGTIREKRKPFQQYHMIDSFSDIIGNNIKANGANVKTVAVPTYKGAGAFFSTPTKKATTLFADWDIYPEYQKTMVIDTGMKYKESTVGGIVTNLILDNVSDNGGKKTAWRMGATALKDSFKDMYEGEVIIIGDSSIKPYDKVFLTDIYEDMSGAFEVEAVVHSLSPDTGFTTSVFADCISTVDSRYEKLGQMWTKEIIANIAVLKTTNYLTNKVFGHSMKPILSIVANLTKKSGIIATDGVNKLSRFIAEKDIVSYAKLEDWYEKFCKTINITPGELNAFNRVNRVGAVFDALNALDFKNLSSTDDVVKALSALVNAVDDLDVSDIINLLDNSPKKNTSEISKAIKELKELKTLDNKQLVKATDSLVKDMIKQFDSMTSLTEEAQQALKALKSIDLSDAKDLKKAISALQDGAKFAGVTNTTKDVAKILAELSDDVKDVAKTSAKTVKGTGITGAITTAIATTTGAPAILATAAAIAVELVLTYVLEKTVYSAIENYAASFNVLTVYPLTKKGTVMVAGIDGHKGLVVGSPTYESTGPMDALVQWAFKDRPGFLGWALDTFVISDNMKAIAETYKKTTIGDADKKESSIQGLLSSIAESQTSSYSNFKALVSGTRLKEPAHTQNSEYTFKKLRIVATDKDNIAGNKRISKDFVPIDPVNQVLQPYFNNLTLNIANTYCSSENANDNMTRSSFEFKLDSIGANVSVYGVDIDNNGIRWDLPLLRSDAFQVFNRILEIANEYINSRGYGDKEESAVWLTSGTIVNDTSWSGTGQVFRFTITHFSGEQITEILEQIKKELRDAAVEQQQDVEIIQYRQVPNSKSFEVYVSPKDYYVNFINQE